MSCCTNTSLEVAEDHTGIMPEIQFHLVTRHSMGEAAGQTLAGAERNPLGNDRYGFSCDSAGF